MGWDSADQRRGEQIKSALGIVQVDDPGFQGGPFFKIAEGELGQIRHSFQDWRFLEKYFFKKT